MKTCQKCQSSFQVTDEDRRILSLFEAPDPDLCFDCRLQRRMTFYNRRKLYKRICDLTGRSIISSLSPDKPYKVYEVKEWYSDKWNPMDYGRDFDFSRSFFEQFNELLHAVPHPSLSIVGENVNSDFTNDNYKLKNCYLVFDGEQAQDSYYGETFIHLENCMDFLLLNNSQKCYEATACEYSYNLKYSQFSKNCSDSWFLKDCIGVKNSFGCVNLRQKEYYIFNEPHTKEEYEAFIGDFDSGDYSQVLDMKQRAESFWSQYPVQATRGVQNENVQGDNVNRSKDSYYCFDSNGVQDCRYCTDCLVPTSKDCMDIHVWGDGIEQCYNCLLVGPSGKKLMCNIYATVGASEIYYSYWCGRDSHNIFGSFGLRHKKYCILNKQYSKEEYETLLPKIIEHMKQGGEWGVFFPPEISMFAYNETLAQEYFPMTKNQVKSEDWKWSDYEVEVKADRTIQASQLPDHIKDIPDDILNWAIICEVSSKPFKLIPQELKFYRENNLSIPRRHPDQRHLDRFKLKSLFHLWERNCAKCSTNIQTPYSPDRPEIVYCEECYLKEIY